MITEQRTNTKNNKQPCACNATPMRKTHARPCKRHAETGQRSSLLLALSLEVVEVIVVLVVVIVVEVIEVEVLEVDI